MILPSVAVLKKALKTPENPGKTAGIDWMAWRRLR